MVPLWKTEQMEVIYVSHEHRCDASFLVIEPQEMAGKIWVDCWGTVKKFQPWSQSGQSYRSHIVMVRQPLNDAALTHMGDTDAIGELTQYVGQGPSLLSQAQVRRLTWEAEYNLD